MSRHKHLPEEIETVENEQQYNSYNSTIWSERNELEHVGDIDSIWMTHLSREPKRRDETSSTDGLRLTHIPLS